MALRVDASYKSSTVLPTVKLEESEGILDPQISGVSRHDETQTNIQLMHQLNSEDRKAKQGYPYNPSMQTSDATIQMTQVRRLGRNRQSDMNQVQII